MYTTKKVSDRQNEVSFNKNGQSKKNHSSYKGYALSFFESLTFSKFHFDSSSSLFISPFTHFDYFLTVFEHFLKAWKDDTNSLHANAYLECFAPSFSALCAPDIRRKKTL
jgi:hypothetical protein